MVNSLLNTAQQLKGMIEHAKIQAEAAKDAAVTQVKLQAEAEKKEVQLKPVNRGRFCGLKRQLESMGRWGEEKGRDGGRLHPSPLSPGA